MTTKETKRHYERPRMKVVKLSNQSPLLVGSGDGLENRPGYDSTDDNPFG